MLKIDAATSNQNLAVLLDSEDRPVGTILRLDQHGTAYPLWLVSYLPVAPEEAEEEIEDNSHLGATAEVVDPNEPEPQGECVSFTVFLQEHTEQVLSVVNRELFGTAKPQ